jgi:1,4-dihydroxy-2-naphthoate polyprenyltransferase
MIKSWLLAARPKTLSAAVVPVLIGTALAPPPIHGGLLACALAGALLIQIGTNFVNDALDFEKGADTAERIGPVRVTQAGLISARGVMGAAYVCFALAVICGIPIVIRGGWAMVVVGLTSIAAAYLYTGGPYPLAYNGLGEIFVMVFFGFVAVGGSYYIQTLVLAKSAVIAGFEAGSLATALLVINNLRDVESDRVSHKRTTVVRFGREFARIEIVFFVFAPFFAQMFLADLLHRDWLLLPLGAAFISLALVRRVFAAVGRELNRCLAMAGALQWAFGILFVASTRIG